MSAEQDTAMYDQPDEPLFDLEPEAPKRVKGGRSLRDIARDQELMRQEMEAGVHKRLNHEPLKVSDVFDHELGATSHDASAARMAHVLIEEHGEGLQLGLKQWSIVQRIVEAAVRVDPADL